VIAAVEAVAWRMRDMSEADLAWIVPIERRAYPFPWPATFFRKCLRSRCICRVMERGGTILGYGVVAVENRRAHVLNLCVRPEFQGRGLGTRLLTHLLALARRRGARYALLEVRPSNYAARGLYQRLGFVRSGVRNRYYPAEAGREDALILTRPL
jgi:ribosomal-protein-alanine N-acetyltransferase